jgi:hypothetical protein
VTRCLADGKRSGWLTSAGGKSDEKGGMKLWSSGFYSRRRERELAVGPHVGINGRRRGSPAVAAVSGRADESPVLRPRSV